MSRTPAFIKSFTSVLTLSTGSMPAYCGKRKTRLDNGSLAEEYPEPDLALSRGTGESREGSTCSQAIPGVGGTVQARIPHRRKLLLLSSPTQCWQL